MSVFEIVLQPASFPLKDALAAAGPQLRLIRRLPRTVGSAWFGLLLMAIMVVGAGSYLAAQTQLSQGAYLEHELTRELKASEATVQELQQQATVLASPATLDQRARALGMVPTTVPVFLRLSDGAVLGSPVAAHYTGESTSRVVTLSRSDIALNPAGTAALQQSQLPTDDSAVLVTKASGQ